MNNAEQFGYGIIGCPVEIHLLIIDFICQLLDFKEKTNESVRQKKQNSVKLMVGGRTLTSFEV